MQSVVTTYCMSMRVTEDCTSMRICSVTLQIHFYAKMGVCSLRTISQNSCLDLVQTQRRYEGQKVNELVFTTDLRKIFSAVLLVIFTSFSALPTNISPLTHMEGLVLSLGILGN